MQSLTETGGGFATSVYALLSLLSRSIVRCLFSFQAFHRVADKFYAFIKLAGSAFVASIEVAWCLQSILT